MRNVKWLLLLAMAMLLLPWLGETVFNSKGEPREAIVAVSMLESGNWILPVSYGEDIPYKPPLLGWLIAIFSLIFNHGVVNEFTSRLPSAIAAIAMVMAGYSWCSRHAGKSLALAMSVITITNLEVFRAAMACRVDMVLTACICAALYLMYQWRLKHSAFLYVSIALLLSGAVLTKGPVGSLLPCLAMGIFCLVRGDNFWRALGWLVPLCLLSLVLPSLWYWRAYQQGGDEFLRLALEENIGRLTGTMSYSSHENPWYYNIITIISGMLPWTIFCLMGTVYLMWKRRKGIKVAQALKGLSQPTVFALVVCVVVLVFYTIPASKRSVYLLPMYPFMAYGVAILIKKLEDRWPLVSYSWIIAVIALVAPAIAIALQWLHPSSMPIEKMPWWRYVFAVIPISVGVIWLRKGLRRNMLEGLMASTMALWLSYSSAFMPMVLNAKTDMHAIAKIAHAQRTYGPVYTYISSDNLLRYYIVNFYLCDTMRRLETADVSCLDRFCVIASPDDIEKIIGDYPDWQFESESLMVKSGDTRRPMAIAKFHK